MELATITPATIANIQDVQEAAQVHYTAKAASIFYEAQDNHEMAQWAKRIYLESARRAGELLLDVDREPGVRSHEVTPYQALIESAGISRFIAATWQKLAEVERETLERYLEDAKHQGTEYTVSGLLSYANGKRDQVYTPESLIKTIGHYVRLFFDTFPDERDALVSTFWEWVRGEWR